MKRNCTKDVAASSEGIMDSDHSCSSAKRLKFTKSHLMTNTIRCPEILFEIIKYVPDDSFVKTLRSYCFITKDISQNLDQFSIAFILSTRIFPICNCKQDFNFVCENTIEIGSLKPEWFRESKKTTLSVRKILPNMYISNVTLTL